MIDMNLLEEKEDYDIAYDSGLTTARGYYAILKKEQPDVVDDYDIIYVDWLNCEADIRDNARLLIEIIDWVNSKKIESRSEKHNVVLGESMGGLVARYALRTMELEGHPHETIAYISHDSPHLGAHIPLGALYGIQSLLLFYYNGGKPADILKIVLEANSAGDILRKYLYSTSAKQMLVNHVNSSGVINNTVHDQWQKELGHIGFPVGDPGGCITNLAIVNGGIIDPPVIRHYATIDGHVYTSGLTDVLSGFVSMLCGRYFNVDMGKWDWLPGKTTIECHVEMNPYFKYNSKVFVFNITYKKNILWMKRTKEMVLFSEIRYSPASGLMYDGFLGSTKGYDPERNFKGGKYNLLLGGYYHNVNLYNKHFMFIPTVSALCFGYGTSGLSSDDYCRVFNSASLKPLVDIPFHGVLLGSGASEHISVLDGMYNWIRERVAITIDGPSSPMSGDKYILNECPYPVVWSSSAPSVLSIDSTTGTVTVHGTGAVTITAEYIAYGQKYSMSKSVMAGFPELYLTAYFDYEKGYVAEVKCRSDEGELEKFIKSGCISYEWGLKQGDESIKWTTSSSAIYETGVSRWGASTTVYIRLKATNGTKGKTYNNMIIGGGNSYYVTPKYFVVNKSGELYSYDPKSGYPCLISQENFPLKICYTMYTHVTPNYTLPRRIVVNDEYECHWTDLPQPDTSLLMSFTICSENELYDLLERMKPNGDMEQFVFWISAYDNEDKLVYLIPIHLVYRPELTGDDFMPDDLPW